MKKITVMAIIIAMLVALTSVVCATSVTAEAGKEVTVTFKLGNTGVRTGDYTIEYNSDYLTYKSATPADKVNTKTANKIKAVFSGIEEGATEITVTFTVKEGVTITKDTDLGIKFVPGELVATNDEVITTVEPQTESVTLTPVISEEQNQGGNNNQGNQQGNTGTQDPTTSEGQNNNNNNSNNSDSQTSADNKDTAATSEDDKTRYDQTGANVAIVGAIALIVALGAVALRKRA